jgi:hypothetical protein
MIDQQPAETAQSTGDSKQVAKANGLHVAVLIGDTSTQELLELNTFGQPPLFSFETSVPGQARKFAPVLSAFCFHADVFVK